MLSITSVGTDMRSKSPTELSSTLSPSMFNELVPRQVGSASSNGTYTSRRRRNRNGSTSSRSGGNKDQSISSFSISSVKGGPQGIINNSSNFLNAEKTSSNMSSSVATADSAFSETRTTNDEISAALASLTNTPLTMITFRSRTTVYDSLWPAVVEGRRGLIENEQQWACYLLQVHSLSIPSITANEEHVQWTQLMKAFHHTPFPAPSHPHVPPLPQTTDATRDSSSRASSNEVATARHTSHRSLEGNPSAAVEAVGDGFSTAHSSPSALTPQTPSTPVSPMLMPLPSSPVYQQSPKRNNISSTFDLAAAALTTTSSSVVNPSLFDSMRVFDSGRTPDLDSTDAGAWSVRAHDCTPAASPAPSPLHSPRGGGGGLPPLGATYRSSPQLHASHNSTHRHHHHHHHHHFDDDLTGCNNNSTARHTQSADSIRSLKEKHPAFHFAIGDGESPAFTDSEDGEEEEDPHHNCSDTCKATSPHSRSAGFRTKFDSIVTRRSSSTSGLTNLSRHSSSFFVQLPWLTLVFEDEATARHQLETDALDDLDRQCNEFTEDLALIHRPQMNLVEKERQHRGFIVAEKMIELHQLQNRFRPRGKHYRPPRDMKVDAYEPPLTSKQYVRIAKWVSEHLTPPHDGENDEQSSKNEDLPPAATVAAGQQDEERTGQHGKGSEGDATSSSNIATAPHTLVSSPVAAVRSLRSQKRLEADGPQDEGPPLQCWECGQDGHENQPQQEQLDATVLSSHRRSSMDGNERQAADVLVSSSLHHISDKEENKTRKNAPLLRLVEKAEAARRVKLVHQYLRAAQFIVAEYK